MSACEVMALVFGALGVAVFVWWIEIGSARRDMMRAVADTLRELGPPPPRS